MAANDGYARSVRSGNVLLDILFGEIGRKFHGGCLKMPLPGLRRLGRDVEGRFQSHLFAVSAHRTV